MSLWKSTDANTSAPKLVLSQLRVAQTQAIMNLAFENTTADVFFTGSKDGVFGVTAAEQNTAGAVKGGHAGWVLQRTGTGGRAGRTHVETIVAMGSMT